MYQGVRVKHTVKDLLAEKRSRQTNGPRYSVSTVSSKLLCFLSCPVSSHFICLPNPTAQPQLTLGLARQLRGRIYKKRNLLPVFTLWSVLWTNDPRCVHWSTLLPTLCLSSLECLQSPSVNSQMCCVVNRHKASQKNADTILAAAVAAISQRLAWGGAGCGGRIWGGHGAQRGAEKRASAGGCLCKVCQRTPASSHYPPLCTGRTQASYCCPRSEC